MPRKTVHQRLTEAVERMKQNPTIRYKVWRASDWSAKTPPCEGVERSDDGNWYITLDPVQLFEFLVETGQVIVSFYSDGTGELIIYDDYIE